MSTKPGVNTRPCPWIICPADSLWPDLLFVFEVCLLADLCPPEESPEDECPPDDLLTDECPPDACDECPDELELDECPDEAATAAWPPDEGEGA